MTQINPYLIFNGNCREAMTFYQQCLGGELTLQTVENSPMADQWPADAQQNILHATLVNGFMVLLATDMEDNSEMIAGNSIYLSLTCSDSDEIRTFFSHLSEGGQVTRGLHEFYAGTIGAITDKFGINWLLYL